jgi:hypothetical protein
MDLLLEDVNILRCLIFPGRPQVLAEAVVDVRRKELPHVHAAARQALLVEVGHQRLKRRTAAFDRVIPGDLADALDLIDDPWKADRDFSYTLRLSASVCMIGKMRVLR